MYENRDKIKLNPLEILRSINKNKLNTYLYNLISRQMKNNDSWNFQVCRRNFLFPKDVLDRLSAKEEFLTQFKNNIIKSVTLDSFNCRAFHFFDRNFPN